MTQLEFLQRWSSRKFIGFLLITAIASYFRLHDQLAEVLWVQVVVGSFGVFAGINLAEAYFNGKNDKS